MATKPARIPLFPLEIVLFPGQAMPLHIFEPRYREMTRHCIDTQSPFGLVYSTGVALAQTGCSAMIVKVLKEYDDGRSERLPAGGDSRREIVSRSERGVPGRGFHGSRPASLGASGTALRSVPPA